MTTALAPKLGADIGTTCVVGAGGKKTLLYRLANELPRAVVTSTVRIPIFDGHVATVAVTGDPVAAIQGATAWPLGVVPAREGNRYLGYDPASIELMASAGAANAVLVKADGARNRLFKAPGRGEPLVPDSATSVVPIASVKAVGKPLGDEHVHRPERVTAITGRQPGESITPADVASVLASDRGGLKGVPPSATPIPVLNMVDDTSLESVAREIAAGIHDRADVSRVVLTSLIADDPVVDVVEP